MNEAYTTEMVQFRRRIHKRPEEGWTEFETMNIVVNRLRELGFKVVMGTKAVNPNFVMGRNPELVAKAMQRAKDHGAASVFGKPAARVLSPYSDTTWTASWFKKAMMLNTNLLRAAIALNETASCTPVGMTVIHPSV